MNEVHIIITFNIVNLVYFNLLKLAKMKLTCNLIYLADYFFFLLRFLLKCIR